MSDSVGSGKTVDVLLWTGRGKNVSGVLEKFSSLTGKLRLNRKSRFRRSWYAAVDGSAKRLCGEKLQRLASISSRKYTNSSKLQYLIEMSKQNIRKHGKRLFGIGGGRKTLLILSSKDHYQERKPCARFGFLRRTDLPAAVIVHLGNPTEALHLSRRFGTFGCHRVP